MALQYQFNEVLDFPCTQNLRIIVNKQEGVEDLLITEINNILESEKPCSHKSLVDHRLSKTGKYISYTVKVYFESAKKLEELYAKLPKHDFVQHVI